MSLPLFKELENIVGKDVMKNLCKEYLIHDLIDNSANRVWKDCSGVYPQAWTTSPALEPSTMMASLPSSVDSLSSSIDSQSSGVSFVTSWMGQGPEGQGPEGQGPEGQGPESQGPAERQAPWAPKKKPHFPVIKRSDMQDLANLYVENSAFPN